MTNEPIHVTDAAFEKVVLQSDIPVLVDFWAPWCAPCLMVAPLLEKIANEHDGELVIAKVNTDEHPEWASKLGVMGIPTMLFVSGGNIIHRQVGALPEPFLMQMVSEFLETVKEGKSE
ncbi:MAG: thioredoxin [Anaerolineales bacterium]|jgi:thioredoxin 1